MKGHKYIRMTVWLLPRHIKWLEESLKLCKEFNNEKITSKSGVIRSFIDTNILSVSHIRKGKGIRG